MTRYRWNGSDFVDAGGNRLVDPAAPYVPAMPQIMSDIPAYRSPVDGRVINSRPDRIADLERHNCREWDPADSPTRGKFRNERFARKVPGAVVAEEYRDLPLNQEFRAKQERAA